MLRTFSYPHLFMVPSLLTTSSTNILRLIMPLLFFDDVIASIPICHVHSLTNGNLGVLIREIPTSFIVTSTIPAWTLSCPFCAVKCTVISSTTSVDLNFEDSPHTVRFDITWDQDKKIYWVLCDECNSRVCLTANAHPRPLLEHRGKRS